MNDLEDLDRYEYFVGLPLLIAKMNTKIREHVCLAETMTKLHYTYLHEAVPFKHIARNLGIISFLETFIFWLIFSS